MKANYAHARAVVRELATDPNLSLTIKAFVAKLGLGKGKRPGKPLPPHYDPYVMCLEAPPEHPDWAGRLWLTSDGFHRSDHADQAYVTQFANEAARRTQAREGGQWCGVIERANNDWPEHRDPQASRKARERVLNGPDSPGQRWLLRRPAQQSERQQIAAALAETMSTAPAELRVPRPKNAVQGGDDAVSDSKMTVHGAGKAPRHQAENATRQDLDAFVDRLKAQPAPVMAGPPEIDWGSENLDPPAHPREPGEDEGT
jgi:hypothetical protein